MIGSVAFILFLRMPRKKESKQALYTLRRQLFHWLSRDPFHVRCRKLSLSGCPGPISLLIFLLPYRKHAQNDLFLQVYPARGHKSFLGGIVSDLAGICGNWDQAVPSVHDPLCLPKVMSLPLTKVQTVAFPQRIDKGSTG